MEKRKKIGLLGLHYGPNYGTILQAYALAKVIRQNGYDCEYVQYCRHLRNPLLRFAIRVIKVVLKWLGLIKINKNDEFYFFKTDDFRKVITRFNKFHKQYIPCSKRKYTACDTEKINVLYDAFVVGSDQTWSDFINSSNDYVFFLPFVNDKAKKKSYAPSIGTISISEDYLKILGDKLADFSYLSCRERQNCNVIEKIAGKKCEYVVDPTLLLTPEEWDEIDSPINLPQQYILCYILGQKQCIVDFAEQLGKEKNLPVYYILTTPFVLDKDKLLDDVGPREFVSLICNASYVVTDSFHGTIFSINYNVNFYSFNKRLQEAKMDNDRIMLILDEFGLKDRFRNDGECQFIDDIDFSFANERMKALRSQSISYLKNMLSD